MTALSLIACAVCRQTDLPADESDPRVCRECAGTSVADHIAEHGESEAAGRAMPPRPKAKADQEAASLAFWKALHDYARVKYGR
jgi:hypothetical protein